MILYVGTKWASSWSMRPYLALVHAGAPVEVKTIWLDQPDSAAELLKASPAARVPVLHHDGLVVWDSLAICEYASELYPAAQLWPVERAARARARALSCEMHAGFAALRRDMPMYLVEDRHGQGHTPEALADAARVQAIWREALAASGGPFLFGAFSIADAMFAPVTTRFTTYGIELDAPCRAYVAAIAGFAPFQRWTAEARAEHAARR